MGEVFTYTAGDELPDASILWYDPNGALVDFSTGYTFQVRLSTESAPNTAVLTKSSGITGAAGDDTANPKVPNVVIAWATGELGLTPGNYVGKVTATRTSDSKNRTQWFDLVILPATT